MTQTLSEARTTQVDEYVPLLGAQEIECGRLHDARHPDRERGFRFESHHLLQHAHHALLHDVEAERFVAPRERHCARAALDWLPARLPPSSRRR